jgi:copper(I)-binding protein
MNNYLYRIITALLLLIGASTATADATLEISEAWVREAPPTARMMAGYMTINNTGDAAVTVISISSPDFDSADIHRTVIEEGVARMLPVKQLEIPASSQVKLEPGGLHLMLFDPKRPLREGETVTLIIHRRDGDPLSTTSPVVRKTGEDHSHHHH